MEKIIWKIKKNKKREFRLGNSFLEQNQQITYTIKERKQIISQMAELEVFSMKKMARIKLNKLDDVKDFVAAASECDFDVDIFYNSFIVDAKSILGVLSLDLTRVLNVTCQDYNRKFEQTLRKYAVA